MALPITPDTLSLAASRLYDQWRHLDVGDPPNGLSAEDCGYPWAVLAAACAAPVDDLYDLLASTETPWAPAFDPELAAIVLRPEFAAALLEWAGQFVGVRPGSGDLPPAGQRLRMRETKASKRGSPESIIGAARSGAIGPDGTPESATVILVERIGDDPYHFGVTMRLGEVADVAGTIRRIEEVTPAGRFGSDPGGGLPRPRFDFNLVEGGNYETLRATHATYGALEGLWDDYAELRTDPGRL